MNQSNQNLENATDVQTKDEITLSNKSVYFALTMTTLTFVVNCAYAIYYYRS